MDLSYENLSTVLSIANGSERNPEQQQAESQLKAWETQKGYHFLLQEIYLKEELPLQLRWLAVICFKNGIEKYWRSSRANAISKEEKTQIKSRLFNLVGEKNNQLAIQNGHSIARIVRFDFPMEWPTLFDDLANSLEENVFRKGDMVATNNLLLILNQVIKTVAVVRVGRARHAMQSKAPIITPVLIRSYLKLFQQWTSVSLDLGLMEVCYLCLKTLRRIITEGFDRPHKNTDVVEFMTISIQHLQMLVVEHEKYSASDMLERYVKCYSKLYVGLISSNPTSFVLFPCSVDIITTFMSLLEHKAELIYNSTEENSFWETLALKGFMILKKIIAFIYKRGAVVLKERNEREEVNAAIQKLTNEVFTTQVVQHLCDLIIEWYLRLKPSDLESWLLEPEEWCNEEISTSWEYQIRPCAENFFQDLITFFKDSLSGFVLNKISNGLANNNNSVDEILSKDAILCTFQLSASSIADTVDFDQLLKDIFIPEGLKNELAENRIVKRRVCLIISEWVSVKCSRESRVEIFRLLVDFLNPDNKINDAVVKLTAIQTLKRVIDDWDFNKYDFHSFLNDFVKLCIQFLGSVEYTESKLYIFNILATMLQRCNPLVDHATLIDILSVIPDYWNSVSSDNESILKNSLLRVLKNLVVSLNDKSTETYRISIPLITTCCTGDTDTFALLSEDGYELWHSVLQYCPTNVDPTSQEELVNLLPLVPHGLLNATEILPTIMSIIRSYALISPDILCGDIGMGIFRALSGYLANMREDAYTVFISLMDILLLQISNNEQFVNNLIGSGLFNAMALFVLDENHDVVSGNKIFLLFSRIAMGSSELFFQMVDHFAIDKKKLFDTWIDNLDRNGNPRNKKLNLIGLLSLCARAIPSKDNVLPLKFAQITKKILLFLEEVNETTEGNCTAYEQDLIYEDIDDYCYSDQDITPHGEKKRYQALIESKDPVFKTNLKSLLAQVLSELRNTLNDTDFRQLISMNDEYSIEKLQTMI
ncbi:importin beta-like protein Kap120p [[Candida] anglica]|uniref:Importin beta-like protein Kap120p n=1 Tax=[Candida] anglica TaxID=148631 RepID=A0ABP0ELZ0_9ASCO